MADVKFKDRNGAGWIIITGGSSIFATPDPESTIHYDPEPADLGPINVTGGDAPGARERDQLVQLINAWAGQHAKEVVLQVTPAKGSGVGWLLLLVLAWAASER